MNFIKKREKKEKNMKILKNDRLEIRRGYFLKGFSRTEEEMAIISFGACKFSMSLL